MVKEFLLSLRNITANIVNEYYEQEYAKMPAKQIKIGSGKFKVLTAEGTKSKATTIKKATSRVKILKSSTGAWRPKRLV